MEISIEISDDDEDKKNLSLFSDMLLLNRLAPKARFLMFGVLFALMITLFTVYYNRQFAETELGADWKNQMQVSLGQSLYHANCAFCHGDQLEGKAGWDKAYLDGGRPARPLNGESAITRLSDQDLMDITKYGGQPFSPSDYKNDMPGFEMQLSDGDIWAIIAYVKSRWPESVIERRRQAMEHSGQ